MTFTKLTINLIIYYNYSISEHKIIDYILCLMFYLHIYIQNQDS